MEVLCEFSDDFVAYKCFVNNIEISDPQQIKKFLGEHKVHRTDNDVVSMTFESCKIKTFPRNLTKFYPNLTVIELISCNLKELTKEDLKFYPKLKYLGIVNNRLTHLGSDLFEYTPNIEFIDFSCNLIHSIGPRILDPISNLKQANFSENQHINALYDADDSRFKIEQLLSIIESCCRPMESLKEIAAAKVTESVNDQNAVELFFYGSRFDLYGMKKKAFWHMKSRMMPWLDEKMFNGDPGKLIKMVGMKTWGSK
ncbi:hypothetical protein ACKWTF_015645 [Chironomus riparius]